MTQKESSIQGQVEPSLRNILSVQTSNYPDQGLESQVNVKGQGVQDKSLCPAFSEEEL